MFYQSYLLSEVISLSGWFDSDWQFMEDKLGAEMSAEGKTEAAGNGQDGHWYSTSVAPIKLRSYTLIVKS